MEGLLMFSIIIGAVNLCTLLRVNYLLEEIHADLEEKGGDGSDAEKDK